MPRIYFYTIFGSAAALIGWGLSQLIFIDLAKFFGQPALPIKPDFVLLPLVAICLAVAMVATEIFLSNPTRAKANRRVLPTYLWRVIGLGTLAGLIASSLTWILYQTNTPDWIVRMTSWSLVGLFTGIGEGISWRMRSIEGSTNKANQRVQRSILFGFGAGFGAAVLLEVLRKTIQLKGYEDPIGFLILGCLLGLALSFATAPTYLVALRAGEGFESIQPDVFQLDAKEGFPSLNGDVYFESRNNKKNLDLPRINNLEDLKFLGSSKPNPRYIEKGDSIKLPDDLDPKQFLIGSARNADIYLPDIPQKAAYLEIDRRRVTITPLAGAVVEVDSQEIYDGEEFRLKRNQSITIYRQNSDIYYELVLKAREYAFLQHSDLRFVTGENYAYIEEGLSIQLPPKIDENAPLVIGSHKEAHIFIPNIPLKAASLIIRDRNFFLQCHSEKKVQIQSTKISKDSKQPPLRHNQILTFYHEDNNEKYYRFVFYDRFLDPEA